MKISEKGVMSAAGSIRGAIAFGLAISIDTSNRVAKEVLISSVLLLVFFTTIVFGALMPLFIRVFKSLDGASNNIEHHDSIEDLEVLFDLSHPNFKET
jgi:NhaP-type Na+/H+ or K+/H+ antiporter